MLVWGSMRQSCLLNQMLLSLVVRRPNFRMRSGTNNFLCFSATQLRTRMAGGQPWGEGWFFYNGFSQNFVRLCWNHWKWQFSFQVGLVPENYVEFLSWSRGTFIWLECRAKYQRFEVRRLNFLVRSVSRQICRSAPQFWALSWEEGELCGVAELRVVETCDNLKNFQKLFLSRV